MFKIDKSLIRIVMRSFSKNVLCENNKIAVPMSVFHLTRKQVKSFNLEIIIHYINFYYMHF